MGMFRTITGWPVFAHKVETTAESTPPETPTIKVERPDASK
jgi:hypothetical protein